MKTIAIKMTAISLAGIALSGCTFPIVEERAEVEAVEPAPVAQAAAASIPVSQPKPVTTNRWAHQRIGNTGATEGGGPSGGDEDSGWNG